uniref:Uncharacterized protein n=1 Tax=Anguilla anguilla TaxID=7936 RepID=A0A0E9Q8X9_ANGAN
MVALNFKPLVSTTLVLRAYFGCPLRRTVFMDSHAEYFLL